MSRPETWDDISEMSRGFMEARIITAAAELEIFDRLEGEGAGAEEVATSFGGELRAFRIILNALTALGLVEKDGERYRNAPLTSRHLVTTSPQYRGDAVKLLSSLLENWMRLEAILRGERTERLDVMEEPERNRLFTRAMHAYHFDEAKEIAPMLGLERAETMLDLGGGAASFSIAFCLEAPNLKAVMVDRPQTLDTAREFVAEHGLSDRIELRAGDFYEDESFELEGPYDIVLISNVLHIEDEERNLALLEKVAGATKPAGRIVINEIALEESGTEPLWGAIFAVNMLVVTDRGDSYPQRTIADWLARAGCERVELLTENLTIGHLPE